MINVILAIIILFLFVIISYKLIKHIIYVCPSTSSDAQQRREFANAKYEFFLKHPTCTSQYITNHIGQLRWSHEYTPIFCPKCLYYISFKEITQQTNTIQNCICSKCQTICKRNLEKCQGIIIFAHGFGMNTLLSMQQFIQTCVNSGYAFFAIDFDGHGLSDGLSGYMHSNSNIMIQDLMDYILYVKNKVFSIFNYMNERQTNQVEGQNNISSPSQYNEINTFHPSFHLIGFSIGATCSILAINKLNLIFKHNYYHQLKHKIHLPIVDSLILVAPFQYTIKQFLPSVLGMIGIFVWKQTVKPFYRFLCNKRSNTETLSSSTVYNFYKTVDRFLSKYDQHFPDDVAYEEYIDCNIAYKSFPSFTSCMAIHQLCCQLDNLLKKIVINIPHILFLHGTDDTITSIESSNNLVKFLKKSNNNINNTNNTNNTNNDKLETTIPSIPQFIEYENVKHTILFGNKSNTQSKIYTDLFEFLATINN